jgi:parallel beta-helix repeat protein
MVVVGVLGGLLFGPPADARRRPPTPVTINCLNDPGLTISTSGRYRLTRSVTDCVSAMAVRIDASNVSLDLDGRKIDGDGGPASMGVAVFGTNVTVSNGSIEEFFANVGVSNGADGARLRNLTLTGGGIGVNAGSAGVAVSGSAVFENLTWGIISAGPGTFRDNVVARNGSAGIETGAASRVSKNSLIENGTDGLVLNGDAGSVAGNVITGNLDNGIRATGSGNVIRSNTIDENSDSGIVLVEDENTISKNKIEVNGLNGIQMENTSNKNSVAKNTIRGQLGDGVLDSGELDVFTKNTVTGNAGSGFNVASDHRFTKNTASGNGGFGILGSDRLVVIGNKLKGNGLDGFNAFSGLRLEQNTASGNAGSGIFVSIPNNTTLIRDNVANENGDYGVDTGGVDVPHSGNIAKDNTQVLQCNPQGLCN